MREEPDFFMRRLFSQLRRRGFPLGLDDYQALQQALHAGFGWESRDALQDLCCALWTKSYQEQEILVSLFDQIKELNDWELPVPATVYSTSKRQDSLETEEPGDSSEVYGTAGKDETVPETRSPSGALAAIPLDDMNIPRRMFVLVPRFPLTYREATQILRRLRRPVYEGPPIEADIEDTMKRRCRLGIAAPVTLMPQRRNIFRPLLLIDRQGSMAPFHSFIEMIRFATEQAAGTGGIACYYFHDVPAEEIDSGLLASLPDQLFPSLDSILPNIGPLTTGHVYTDPELLSPQPLRDVLEAEAADSPVVLFSDAGAARGSYDVLRMINTIALLKALREFTSKYAWLNPLPRKYWAHSTAAQIARHVPMFPLDQIGLHSAVNVLRGQVYRTERPIS